MSKKTLIILLVLVVVGILVIVFFGKGTNNVEEDFIPVEDDTFFDFDQEEMDYTPTPVEDELLDLPVEESTLEEPVVEEDLME